MPAQPVCLACRRPLDPPCESGELSLSLDGPDVLAVAREMAATEADDEAAQAVLAELLAGLCRVCGRSLI